MSAPRGDTPTLGVIVTGGIGVLIAIAFVAGIVLGRETRTEPGDRVGVTRVDGEVVILAARCEDERVRAVEVRTLGGAPLWRIESEKGTIDRRFVVGGEPPPFFLTVVRLEGLPATGELEAEVTVDEIVDARRFDPGALEGADEHGVSCDDHDLGLVPLVFVVGALAVVAAYGAMVSRYVRGP